MIKKPAFLFIIIFSGIFAFLILKGSFEEPFPDGHSPALEDFALLDHEGRMHQMSYYTYKKGIVLMSYGIGCPIARHTVIALKELRDKYARHGYLFFLIDPVPADTRNALKKEADDFKIDIPILMDESQMISKALGIQRTAEVIFINGKDRRLIYRGALDDRLGYETQKDRAGRPYLKNAIHRHFWRLPVVFKSTEVKGCLISYDELPEISYEKDVVPILEHNCLRCHNRKGKAPWVMDSYDKIKSWSAMMREVVRIRRMPPYSADTYYRQVKDGTFLKPQEVKTLLTWLEQEARQSSHADPLPAAEKRFAENEWPWGEPDIILTTEKIQRIPATGSLDLPYSRTFENFLEEDAWVQGVYYKSDNEKVLHHSSLWLETRSDIQTPSSDSSPEIKGLEYVTFNAPGLKQFYYPEGTGKFFPKDAKLRMYTHYVTTGRDEEERQQVGLYLYKNQQKPIKQVILKLLEKNVFSIPPGVQNFSIQVKRTMEEDVVLYGISPHMHYRGKSAQMTARYPDGREEMLLSVPDYDYDWLVPYQLKEAVDIPAGTVITLNAVFDNSRYNTKNLDPSITSTFGFERRKEMLWGGLMFVAKEEYDKE